MTLGSVILSKSNFENLVEYHCLYEAQVKFYVIFIVIVTTGASCLSELLKVNNSLQELYMGANEFGDDGMSLLVDGLQCNNTSTKLNVGRCGLSVKGTVVYKTEFKTIWSLQFLYSYIWSNKIRLIPYFSVEVTTGRNANFDHYIMMLYISTSVQDVALWNTV